MTEPLGRARWYITRHAVERYMYARRWPDDDPHWERAEAELLDTCNDAALRGTDAQRRELWRSPKQPRAGRVRCCSRHDPPMTGGALRWVVDPRPHPGGELPAVVWVGYGAPSSRYYGPST